MAIFNSIRFITTGDLQVLRHAPLGGRLREAEGRLQVQVPRYGSHGLPGERPRDACWIGVITSELEI